MEIQSTESTGRQVLGLENAPYLKSSMSTRKIMLIVLLSLIPAAVVQIYFFGMGMVLQFLICAITAIIMESMVAILRKRPILHALSDYSYLVTALLLAFTLPQLLPWYYSVIATSFAIIVVKSIFGGLGNNIFNPAMAGFIFVVISCPHVMTNTFIIPNEGAFAVANLKNVAKVIFDGENPDLLRSKVVAFDFWDHKSLKKETRKDDNHISVDSFTGATFLENIKAFRKSSNLHEVSPHSFLDNEYLSYLCLAVAYAFGGLILCLFRIIIMRMVVAFFAAFIGIQYVMNLYYPGVFMNVTDALLFGGTMLGAFYIITDPVTNAGTSKGRIYFAILVAFLIVFLRGYGSYSDAVAFAVMLANACAPLIDKLTSRRTYGVKFSKEDLYRE